MLHPHLWASPTAAGQASGVTTFYFKDHEFESHNRRSTSSCGSSQLATIRLLNEVHIVVTRNIKYESFYRSLRLFTHVPTSIPANTPDKLFGGSI